MRTFQAILMIIILTVQACRNDPYPQEPVDDWSPDPGLYHPVPVSLEYPFYIPALEIPADNPPTVEGIVLGRRLFYDPILHPGGAMACSTCHQQETAFTTPSSNSLAHINLGWSPSFLWNGKVEGSLEDIMLFEVEDFFGTNLSTINKDTFYRNRFMAAFGVEVISAPDIARALAQFTRSLISYETRFDRALVGQYEFSEAENRGYMLFFSERGDCFHCHGNVFLTDFEYRNNGLDTEPDAGRYSITGRVQDIGKFKTPTLRNIEFTAPYMHDGRFATLEEVLDFYSEGLQYSATVDPLMKNVHAGGLHLTGQEKSDIIAFLKTFSDSTFITYGGFGPP